MIGLPLFFLFLFIPLIPVLGSKKEIRHCPVCGWQTNGSERFCPYDATLFADSIHREEKDEP